MYINHRTVKYGHRAAEIDMSQVRIMVEALSFAKYSSIFKLFELHKEHNEYAVYQSIFVIYNQSANFLS